MPKADPLSKATHEYLLGLCDLDRPLPTEKCRWRCHECGNEPKTWAAAERHADQAHHYRIEVVLTGNMEPNSCANVSNQLALV